MSRALYKSGQSDGHSFEVDPYKETSHGEADGASPSQDDIEMTYLSESDIDDGLFICRDLPSQQQALIMQPTPMQGHTQQPQYLHSSSQPRLLSDHPHPQNLLRSHHSSQKHLHPRRTAPRGRTRAVNDSRWSHQSWTPKNLSRCQHLRHRRNRREKLAGNSAPRRRRALCRKQMLVV